MTASKTPQIGVELEVAAYDCRTGRFAHTVRASARAGLGALREDATGPHLSQPTLVGRRGRNPSTELSRNSAPCSPLRAPVARRSDRVRGPGRFRCALGATSEHRRAGPRLDCTHRIGPESKGGGI